MRAVVVEVCVMLLQTADPAADVVGRVCTQSAHGARQFAQKDRRPTRQPMGRPTFSFTRA